MIGTPLRSAWERAGALRWLAGAIILAAIAFALWWLLVRPGVMQDRAAVSRAQETVTKAAPEIARETLREVERFNETRIEIRERVAAGEAGIRAAEGASAAIPPAVAAAGRRALCLHAEYRDDPGCAALP